MAQGLPVYRVLYRRTASPLPPLGQLMTAADNSLDTAGARP
jgi:hypothetical protein